MSMQWIHFEAGKIQYSYKTPPSQISHNQTKLVTYSNAHFLCVRTRTCVCVCVCGGGGAGYDILLDACVLAYINQTFLWYSGLLLTHKPKVYAVHHFLQQYQFVNCPHLNTASGSIKLHILSCFFMSHYQLNQSSLTQWSVHKGPLTEVFLVMDMSSIRSSSVSILSPAPADIWLMPESCDVVSRSRSSNLPEPKASKL